MGFGLSLSDQHGGRKSLSGPSPTRTLEQKRRLTLGNSLRISEWPYSERESLEHMWCHGCGSCYVRGPAIQTGTGKYSSVVQGRPENPALTPGLHNPENQRLAGM